MGPPFNRSNLVTATRSSVSAAKALPSSAARSTWCTRPTAYGSSITGLTNPGVPRRVVVSAAISATTSTDGYTAPYRHPSGTPARPVCGVSGFTSARAPAPAY